MRIIRVFPRYIRRWTPEDAMAFVGDPPMMRPEADEVRVSCTFSWDRQRAKRLAQAWGQYYPVVRLGGPAFGMAGPSAEGFVPGLYIRAGVTFTTRGCDRACPYCLVPEREGRLMEIPDFAPGHIIADNNFLQASMRHRGLVYEMLRRQSKAAIFSGGLQASLVTDEIADELRQVRIDSIFLAADTVASLKPLAQAVERLSYLSRRKLRCYMLLAFNRETIQQAEQRLEAAWQMGTMPFAQLFQPPERWINYSPEWKALARKWSRPAAMVATHRR